MRDGVDTHGLYIRIAQCRSVMERTSPFPKSTASMCLYTNFATGSYIRLSIHSDRHLLCCLFGDPIVSVPHLLVLRNSMSLRDINL